MIHIAPVDTLPHAVRAECYIIMITLSPTFPVSLCNLTVRCDVHSLHCGSKSLTSTLCHSWHGLWTVQTTTKDIFVCLKPRRTCHFLFFYWCVVYIRLLTYSPHVVSKRVRHKDDCGWAHGRNQEFISEGQFFPFLYFFSYFPFPCLPFSLPFPARFVLPRSSLSSVLQMHFWYA